MKTLTLALKSIYFDQIKSGEKVEEFRLITDYWRTRLYCREYDRLVLTRGYPKSDDSERRIILPYRGYRLTKITHPHFGPNPVDVFAIKVAA